MLTAAIAVGIPWSGVLILAFRDQIASGIRRLFPDKQTLHESGIALGEIRKLLDKLQSDLKRIDGRTLEMDRKIAGLQTFLGTTYTEVAADPEHIDDDPVDEELPEPVRIAPLRSRGGMGRYT